MKKILIFLLALALAGVANAADLDLDINNAPLQDAYELEPGTSLDVAVRIAPGILIREINVDADKRYYETLFESSLAEQFRRDRVETQKQASIIVPKQIPSGDSNVAVTITYEDAQFNTRTVTFETLLQVKKGSKLLGFFSGILPSRVMDELIGASGAISLQKLDENLNLDDLDRSDYNALGLTLADLNAGNIPTITKTNTKTTQKSETPTKYKRHVIGSLHPEIHATTNAFTVNYNGKTLTKSKILISVPGAQSISDVSSLAIIPKEIAQTTKDIRFSEKPNIIEEDPVIKWQFSNIPEGQAKEYSMVVDGDATKHEIQAAAAGEKISWITRFILWILGK